MEELRQAIKRKLRTVVYLHGIHVKNLTGLEINQEKEYKRLYAEWQAGFITLADIQEDIDEYLKLRKRLDALHPTY